MYLAHTQRTDLLRQALRSRRARIFTVFIQLALRLYYDTVLVRSAIHLNLAVLLSACVLPLSLFGLLIFLLLPEYVVFIVLILYDHTFYVEATN